MEILINGVKETTKYEGSSLGDILDQIQETKVLPGTYISQLCVNTQPADANAEKTRLIPVPGIEILEIEIANLLDILSKNIVNAEDYLNKMIPGIEKAAELFQLENEQEANKYFLNIVDGIDWLSQVLNEIVNALQVDASSHQIKGKTFQERQAWLVQAVKQLLEANQSKDWVLVADLLEYEIAPYYREWLSIVPELKQMARESVN